MARRSIGQERFGFVGGDRTTSSLDTLASLLDWTPIAVFLDPLYAAAKGEPAWPPPAMVKALLLSIWYDLSDVKLADALDDRASFRRFCGFSATKATPERTTFVRFRRLLVAHKLDRALFETITTQLKSKAVTVKTGTLVDTTIIASATEGDEDARWVKHKGKRDLTHCQRTPGRCLPTARIAAITFAMQCAPRAASRGSSPPECGAATNRKRCASFMSGTNPSIACAAGSRRSSEHGSDTMACAECDGVAAPKPPSRSALLPSPTISSAP